MRLPNYKIADRIERELVVLVELKRSVLSSLRSLVEAWRHADKDPQPLLDSIDIEQAQLSGYELALVQRRKQLGGEHVVA